MHKGIITGSARTTILPSVIVSLLNGTVPVRYADGTKAVGYTMLLFRIGSALFGGAADPFAGSVLLIGTDTLFYHYKLVADYMNMMPFPAAPLLKDGALELKGNGVLPVSFVVLFPDSESPAKRRDGIPKGNNVLSVGTMVMPDSDAALSE